MEKAIKWVLCLIWIPFFFSCIDDNIYSESDVTEGEEAMIKLSIDKSEQTDAKTRTVGTGTDDNVKYVHILIFNSNTGALKTIKYIPDYTGGTIAINTASGYSVIYAIANLSTVNAISGTGATYFDDVTTLAQFQNKMAKIKLINNFAEPLLLMSGKSNIIPIYPGQNSPTTISMNRLSSLIILNFIKKIPVTDRLELQSWEVINAPGYSYIDQKGSDAITDRAEALNDSNYFRSPVQNFNTVVLPNLTPATQGVFYTFENRKGNVTSVTSQKERAAKAPKRATFILVKGRYTNPYGIRDISYKIHLGKDSLTDYNINRNYKYTYTVTVKSADQYSTQVDVSKQDSRVDVSDLCTFDMNELTLDAHYEWRPIRLRARLGFSKIEVVDAVTEQPTSDPDKQWLKLSLSPTWPTLLEIAANALLGTGLSITSNLSITGLGGLMIYAYADEMFKGEVPITTERRLKLKITYTPTLNILNLGNTDSSYVFTKEIVQRPIMMMGDMGLVLYNQNGTLENNGGIMFGVERREEAVLKLGFTGIPSTGLQTMMPWGFFGIQKQPTTTVSTHYYRRNGYQNTVNLVWKNSLLLLMYSQILSADFGSILISGIFDPIYNTYAARYCFEKNRDLNGDGFIKDDEIKWYLPARAEQALIWIGKWALNGTGTDLPSESCWSSTEGGDIYTALNLNFYDGGTGGTFMKNDNRQHVRCVRRLNLAAYPLSTTKSPYVLTNTRIIQGLPAAVSVGHPVHVKSVPFPIHGAEGSLNTIAPRFEVARYDCGLNGSQVASGTVSMEWYKACGWSNQSGGTAATTPTGCNAYWEGSTNNASTGVGMWRMPTQRELMCIALLNPFLVSDGISPLAPANYWSSPNYYTEAWYTNMNTGYTGATNRPAGDPLVKQYVRCVRDAY